MNKKFGAIVVFASSLLTVTALGAVAYKAEGNIKDYTVVDLGEKTVVETSALVWEEMSVLEKANFIQDNIDSQLYTPPSDQVLSLAISGYENLVEQGQITNNKLTVVDFSLSSAKKRLWVIDMDTHQVILQSYVAHGRKTGQEFAQSFSNKINSHQSSLGFYRTAETYQGRNGFSLRLDGLDKGVNDNARVRAIVIHGADYANENLIDAQGFIGRSYGCPAVPTKVNRELIELIKDQSCLFIYHNSLSV